MHLPHKTIALMTTLLLTGCASTPPSIVSYQAFAKPTARETIKIDPELLKVEPLTPAPPARSPEDIHKRAIIFGSDLVKERSARLKLIGAIEQREFSEEQIRKAEQDRAEEIDALIEKLNATEAARAKPWWKIF